MSVLNAAADCFSFVEVHYVPPVGAPLAPGTFRPPPTTVSAKDVSMLTELDTHNFDAVVQSGKQVVLVDFWAPWCGPCKTQLPILERIASDAAATYRVAKVNVDDNEQLAARYGVTSIPTLLLFRHGEPVARLTGLQQERTLRDALHNATIASSDPTGVHHAPNNATAIPRAGTLGERS